MKNPFPDINFSYNSHSRLYQASLLFIPGCVVYLCLYCSQDVCQPVTKMVAHNEYRVDKHNPLNLLCPPCILSAITPRYAS